MNTSDQRLSDICDNASALSKALAAQIRALESFKFEQDRLVDETTSEYLRRSKGGHWKPVVETVEGAPPGTLLIVGANGDTILVKNIGSSRAP